MNSEHSHILPIRTYLAVFGGLLVLTVLTVAVARVDLGGWNAVVAVGIASLKASLVALFFMHLLYDEKIMLFIFLSGIFFISLFIMLTMFDTARRADLYEETAMPIQREAEIYRQPADTTQTQQAPEPSH